MSPGASEWPLGSGSVDPTPWGGPNSAGGIASGVVTLQHPGGILDAVQWKNVAAWRGDSAKPVTVQVKTTREVLTQLGGGYTEATGVFTMGGILRFQYGMGAALRTLHADIRAGSFQLPPCEFVTLDAGLWQRSVDPATVTVSAGIVAGWFPNPSRLTSSQRLTIFQGDQHSDYPPEGARWVALSGGGATDIGVGQPIVVFTQDEGGLYLRHDYQAGVFLSQPGQPVELLNLDGYTVRNQGPNEAQFNVRFYLEV